MMPASDLESLISQCLDDFYRRRLLKARELKLRAFLRGKNPYLFRAFGIYMVSDIVENLLTDYVGASRDNSGQAFWQEVTGDPEFYPKLVKQFSNEYQPTWDAIVNRLTLEFISDFCFPNGSIDWEKLERLVSEDKAPTQARVGTRKKEESP